MATTDNLGPMPTPVALPARCRVPVVPAACSSSACTGSRGLACATGTATADPGCWPPATVPASAAAAAGLLGYGGSGYYSPAVACPVGYATAGGTASVVAGDGGRDGGADATVYRVHCCPR
jgi:hypothetical protein